MSRPQNTGLVELVDEKTNDKGFFCMDLVRFIGEETDKTWDNWQEKFERAKAGDCPYRDRCPRHARTVAKGHRRIIQLKLF